MRSKPVLTYSFLFFLSGATGLIYELLWVRVLYQSFGSTIQSVTTVVAAYMGGLGLGAWLLGRRADRSPRPAVLYGWLEIAIGIFGILSPLVLGLAHRIYIGTAGALALGGGASVALRFGLAALVLLIPTTLMGGTLPVLTRALMGEDRGLLKPSLGRLYGLNTLGAMTGTALAGFFLIEFVGVRASLWATAAINIAIGVAAIVLGREQSVSDPRREPGEAQIQPATRDHLTTLALVLLGLTAFASLLNEIAWTRVLIMLVGGSTYAFTLILLVFLLGIGLGSIIVARRSEPRAETAASAAHRSHGPESPSPRGGRRLRLRAQYHRQHPRSGAHRIRAHRRIGNAGDATPRARSQRDGRSGPRWARRTRRRGGFGGRPPTASPRLVGRGFGNARARRCRRSARLEHATH